MALCLSLEAQRFFDLTAEEVRIDSLLPVFNYEQELGANYADSVYTVTIDYPEFIDMSPTDVRRYQTLTSDPLPAMPEVHQYVGVSRKQGTLYVSFVPLVCRNGKMQKLVSFRLTVQSAAIAASRASFTPRRSPRTISSHSVLSTGIWAKIRVPETGIYQLTDALCRKAGFSNPSRVRIYGYGGALQPEKLSSDYLSETDDLQEVPTCTVNGRRLFLP